MRERPCVISTTTSNKKKIRKIQQEKSKKNAKKLKFKLIKPRT